MRRRVIGFVLSSVIAAALVGTPADAQDRVRLTGSGASFPFPLYSAWFKAFSGKSKAIAVDYQAKGSGAGIQDFINRTVDFAGSDAAMTDEDIAKVPGGVQLLPMTGGEIALAYNVAGVKGLKLPRDVYTALFLGKITRWSPDPEGAGAYPIATYTWLLLYKKNQDPKKAAALRELVDYCLTEGQKTSAQMGYIPLPENVASAVRKAAATIQ